MALQTSGQMTTAEIQTEFGDTGSISTSDMYRGAGLIDDVTENSAVPASGIIVLPTDLYGAANNYVRVDNHTLDAQSSSGTTAQVTIRYRSGATYTTTPGPSFVENFTVEGEAEGDVFTSGDSSNTRSETTATSLDTGWGYYLVDGWINTRDDTNITAGDYQIRFTLQSGDTPTGTFGTWMALSSDREVTLSAFSLTTQIKSCSVLVEIRKGSSGAAYDSATITMSASSG